MFIYFVNHGLRDILSCFIFRTLGGDNNLTFGDTGVSRKRSIINFAISRLLKCFAITTEELVLNSSDSYLKQ